MVRRKAVNIGDVLEIKSDGGRIYVQYVGTHPDYGDLIFVCPHLQPGTVEVSSALFRDGYLVFYAIKRAASKGWARVVGQLPAPMMPTAMTRRGPIKGNVRSWVIVQDSTGQQTVKTQLSAAERQLPLLEILGHGVLVDMVTAGTRPWDEETDGHDSAVGPPLEDHPPPMQVTHYLYVAHKKASHTVRSLLVAEGFDTECERAADGSAWKVRATHRIVVLPETMEALRVHLDHIALSHGGEYDGWEAQVSD